MARSARTGVPSVALVGGSFLYGASRQEPVVAFDGTNWSYVADAFPTGSVYALGSHKDMFGTELYAGGSMASNNQPNANTSAYLRNVGRLSAGHWRAMGGGFGLPGASTLPTVYALANRSNLGAPDTVLYAGGDFDYAGGIRVNRVARWLHRQWEPMGAGIAPVSGWVTSMVLHDDGTGMQLYAAGQFDVIDGVSSLSNIARWNEVTHTWSAVGGGLNPSMAPIYLAVYDANDGMGPNLYAADNTGRCFRWTGSTWFSLPAIPFASVRQLRAIGPKLPIGSQTLLATGTTSIDGNGVVARWTGTGWKSVGFAGGAGWCSEPFSFPDTTSFCRLYAGGVGITADSGYTTIGHFARYNDPPPPDSLDWEKPANNILGTIQLLQFLADPNPVMLVVGDFDVAFTSPTEYNVALWSGSVWDPVDAGVLAGPVDAATVFDDGIDSAMVYLAGNFTTAGTSSGGASSHSIGRFKLGRPDSLHLCTCDPLLTDPDVHVTAPNGGEVLLVGDPKMITWTAYCPKGVDSLRIELSTDGGATYPNLVARGIANSGSYNWTVPNMPTTTARIRISAFAGSGGSSRDASDADFQIKSLVGAPPEPLPREFALMPVMPTPSPGGASVEYALPVETDVRLSVLDLSGREVAVLAEGRVAAGRHTVRWGSARAGASPPPGLYFVRFRGGGRQFVRRLVLAR